AVLVDDRHSSAQPTPECPARREARRKGPAVTRAETNVQIRGLLRSGDKLTERNRTNGQGNGRGTGIEAPGSSRPHRGRRASKPSRRRPSPPPQEGKAETEGRTGRPPHPLRRPFCKRRLARRRPEGLTSPPIPPSR